MRGSLKECLTTLKALTGNHYFMEVEGFSWRVLESIVSFLTTFLKRGVERSFSCDSQIRDMHTVCKILPFCYIGHYGYFL